MAFRRPRPEPLGETIEVERMGLERRPVTDYAPRSTAGRAYQLLWDEIRENVSGLRPTRVVNLPF